MVRAAEPKVSSAGGEAKEVAQRFLPTPERVSQYLERNVNEVTEQFASVEGRKLIVDDLLKHETDIRKLDPEFNPQSLRSNVDLVGETLSQKKRYLEQMEQPEKKSMLSRAWSRVKGFAKKHPVVTTLLVASLVAGGVATAFYLTGNIELLMASTGLNKVFDGVKAAKDYLIPMTPSMPALPGGGLNQIPSPPSPPSVPGFPT